MAQYALDDLTFNFVPSGLPMPDIIAGDHVSQSTANDIFRQAYRMAYNEWPKLDLGKNWQRSVSNAKEAQMDFKTFCLFVITGYMITHEHTPFYASVLAAATSIEKVEAYRKACKRKFNSSDARSLGLMLNLEFYDIDDEMLLSEISFGRYITGLVKHDRTDHIPFYIYDHDEISFSPYWLTIEPTYQKTIFRPFLKAAMAIKTSDKTSLGTTAQLRHRHLVSQVISALKRRSSLAATVFTSRSRVMLKAVKSVLDHHGIRVNEKISDNVAIDDAYGFWRQLGDVVASKNRT